MEKFNDWHFYLGCNVEVLMEDEHGQFTIKREGTLSYNHEEDDVWILVKELPGDDFDFDCHDFRWKPILRDLKSMTESEQREEYLLTRFCEGDRDVLGRQGMARGFQYLLSRGFDLFGLIKSGQAIDQATLKDAGK